MYAQAPLDCHLLSWKRLSDWHMITIEKRWLSWAEREWNDRNRYRCWACVTKWRTWRALKRCSDLFHSLKSLCVMMMWQMLTPVQVLWYQKFVEVNNPRGKAWHMRRRRQRRQKGSRSWRAEVTFWRSSAFFGFDCTVICWARSSWPHCYEMWRSACVLTVLFL